MVSWGWIPICFIAGAVAGMFLAALLMTRYDK